MAAAGAGEAQRVELETPLEPASSIARLVLGGIAARMGLTLDDLDDLQLAVERVLAEAYGQERIRLTFEWTDERLCAYVGPLPERAIAAALEGREGARGEPGLRRVLETVVDSVAIERGDDDAVVVCLEKHARRR